MASTRRRYWMYMSGSQLVNMITSVNGIHTRFLQNPALEMSRRCAGSRAMCAMLCRNPFWVCVFELRVDIGRFIFSYGPRVTCVGSRRCANLQVATVIWSTHEVAWIGASAPDYS